MRRPSARTVRMPVSRTASSASPNSVDGYTCVIATPKPSPRRPAPVGERHDRRLAVAHDEQRVHLEPRVERLEDRLLVERLRQRRVQVQLEIVLGLEQEEPALPGRVGRLQHRREADPLRRDARLVQRAHRRELRLRHAVLREGARIAILLVIPCATSRPIPGRPSSSATAATTGTARSDATVITPSTAVRGGRPRRPRPRRGSRRPPPRRRARARARPRCGRRRRRARRAPSRARARGAGGVPRRRRGECALTAARS